MLVSVSARFHLVQTAIELVIKKCLKLFTFLWIDLILRWQNRVIPVAELFIVWSYVGIALLDSDLLEDRVGEQMRLTCE